MKNIFKTLNYYRKVALFLVSAFMMGVVITSCSDDIIELEPYSSVSETSAFSTPSLIETSVNGMYQAAQMGWYNSSLPGGAPRGYIWGAAFVQQGDNRGEDVVNIASFYAFTYQTTYNATTANNIYYWFDAYRLINRANIVIDGVTKAVAAGTITAAVGDDYIGQALFLRAITHMELLTHFAKPYKFTAGATHLGVPYRTVPYTTEPNVEEGKAQGRNSVKECYDLIIKDLNDARDKMISKSARGSVKLGIVYASKEAATAMKTRAYLNMGLWDDVITEGVKLNSLYSLTPSPDGPFAANYSNTESIFSLEQTASNNPGQNAALASQYNGRKLVCMSPIIWRDTDWLQDDKRRQIGTMVFESVSTDGKFKTIFTNKYKDPTNFTDASPIIRFAEVKLNMAEAYARKASPDLTNALTQLNLVRDRSLANPATQSHTSTTLNTQTKMVEAILKERRIEFAMEGRRWGDIHRLQHETIGGISGIPAKIANGEPLKEHYVVGTPYTGAKTLVNIPYSDYRFLWPIPQAEVDANPILKAQQNPGW